MELRKFKGHGINWDNQEYDFFIIFGEKDDIKSIYKSMRRASNRNKTFYCPLYIDFPLFSRFQDRYGIIIRLDDETFTIIKEEHVESLLVGGYIYEEDGIKGQNNHGINQLPARRILVR